MASARAFLSSSFTFSAYERLKTSSVCFNLHQFGHSVSRNKASDFIFIPLVSITRRHSTVWRNRTTLHASAYALNAVASAAPESPQDPDHIPMSIVVIVQDFDCDVTIVKLSFGDHLGALIDTMEKLVDFGLAVLKGALFTEGSDMQTEFAIKILETGNKVEDPDMLDKLRLSIINNLLKYHPESSEQLAMGEVLGVKAPKMKILVDITAVLNFYEDGPFRRFALPDFVDTILFVRCTTISTVCNPGLR